MRKTKSYKLESILEQRIRMGNYTLLNFPAERRLASTAARVNGSMAVFLAPSFLSSHIFMFQRMLAAVAREAGWQLQTILYMH